MAFTGLNINSILNMCQVFNLSALVQLLLKTCNSVKYFFSKKEKQFILEKMFGMLCTLRFYIPDNKNNIYTHPLYMYAEVFKS